jgi:transposase
MYPTPEQAAAMLAHCGHARYVWNLALEQFGFSSRERRCPGYAEQDRQLCEARAEFPWLGTGSSTVQQQALRDFRQALTNWWSGTHRRPSWRKKGRHEGFRIVGAQAQRVEQLNGKWARVLIPKVGWVRFRRTRAVPGAKSYRVTRDPSGRWHIAFAAIPEPVNGPGDGTVVGVDRGVAATLAYSDGTMRRGPTPKSTARLQRKLARANRGSNRRAKVKARLARLHARNADARKDFLEKASTDLARRADLIRIENLNVSGMTRSACGTVAEPGRNVAAKAGLNRSILAGGWTLFATRLEHKAPGRVEKIDPAYTSQCCSVCGHVAAESRKSQALFVCIACGHTSNADVNAAQVIAAGRVVTARRDLQLQGGSTKREPQLAPLSAA